METAAGRPYQAEFNDERACVPRRQALQVRSHLRPNGFVAGDKDGLCQALGVARLGGQDGGQAAVALRTAGDVLHCACHGAGHELPCQRGVKLLLTCAVGRRGVVLGRVAVVVRLAVAGLELALLAQMKHALQLQLQGDWLVVLGRRSVWGVGVGGQNEEDVMIARGGGEPGWQARAVQRCASAARRTSVAYIQPLALRGCVFFVRASRDVVLALCFAGKDLRVGDVVLRAQREHNVLCRCAVSRLAGVDGLGCGLPAVMGGKRRMEVSASDAQGRGKGKARGPTEVEAGSGCGGQAYVGGAVSCCGSFFSTRIQSSSLPLLSSLPLPLSSSVGSAREAAGDVRGPCSSSVRPEAGGANKGAS